MTGGYEKNQQRLQALSLLGKDLARRSGRKCELCTTSGVSFRTREIEPIPDTPSLDSCLLLCSECDAQMDRRGGPDPRYWRCLESTAWSEIPAVQVTAVRLLREIDEDWSQQLADQLYLWPESERWLAASP